MSGALPPSERPFADDRYSTRGLHADRDLPDHAIGWIGAPQESSRFADDIEEPVESKRRIGDLVRSHRFDLDGRTCIGWGPDGHEHVRFGTWNESLLAEPTTQ